MLTEGLYTLATRSNGGVTLVLCGPDHPVFRAHFPGNPILPGFLHLEIAAELFEKTIAEVISAKFLKPVFPSDTVILEVREKEKETRLVWSDEVGSILSQSRIRWE